MISDLINRRGQIYTQFDAKWVYILCVTLFEVGSAICGAAPNMSALIIGRVICGLGGGGMYTGVMVLLSANTTEQERPSYFGKYYYTICTQGTSLMFCRPYRHLLGRRDLPRPNNRGCFL